MDVLSAIADEDDAVLAAALSLIDDVYGAADAQNAATSSAVSRPAWSAQRRQAVAQLSAQVAELEQIYAQLHYERFGYGNEVVQRRRAERERAEAENQELKSTVKAQATLVKRTARLWQQLHQLAHSAMVPRRSGRGRTLVASELIERLDELTSALISDTSHGSVYPPIGSRVDSISTRWMDEDTQLEMNYHNGHYVPFKLSLVADEVWRQLHDQPLTSIATCHHPNKIYRQFQREFSRPFGSVAMHGSTVFRRTFAVDGSVLIALSSFSTGIPSRDHEEPNLMEGYAIRHTVWARISRPPDKALVYIESMSRCEMRPEATTTRDPIVGLRRLEMFMRCMDEELSDPQRQTLESRLMDATMATEQRVIHRGA